MSVYDPLGVSQATVQACCAELAVAVATWRDWARDETATQFLHAVQRQKQAQRRLRTVVHCLGAQVDHPETREGALALLEQLATAQQALDATMGQLIRQRLGQARGHA